MGWNYPHFEQKANILKKKKKKNIFQPQQVVQCRVLGGRLPQDSPIETVVAFAWPIELLLIVVDCCWLLLIVVGWLFVGCLLVVCWLFAGCLLVIVVVVLLVVGWLLWLLGVGCCSSAKSRVELTQFPLSHLQSRGCLHLAGQELVIFGCWHNAMLQPANACE